MAKEVVSSQLMKGGAGAVDQLPRIVREMYGYTISSVAGAAAGTQMNIAALRSEDTLLAVLDLATGVDDAANCTIQSNKATGTLTVSGNPVDGETFVVGTKTYTFKTTPAALGDVKITTGDNNAMAAAVASAVNTWENRYDGSKQNTAMIAATVTTNVVTFTSVQEGAGNVLTITNSANCTIAGSPGVSVTGTCASMVNTNTVTVNGIVFTVRTTPTAGVLTDVAIGADNTAQALLLANAVNVYGQYNGNFDAKAVAAAAVVTFTPKSSAYGNTLVLTEGVTNVAVSGSGTLAGGSATGGFKSITNLSAKTMIVHWLNKNP